MKYLYFVFYLYGISKVCYYLPIGSVHFFPWRQNGTSLALKAYPTYRWTAVLSKIKLESRVFWLASLHLRPSSGWTQKKAWPCSEAFSGCSCHRHGDWLFCTLFFFFFFIIYLWLPQDDTKDPSLRKHTQKAHYSQTWLLFKLSISTMYLNSWLLHLPFFRFPESFGIVVLRVDKTSIRDKKSKNWF